MNILVTGATGFVGRHLCDYLLRNTDDNVYGTNFHKHSNNLINVNIYECDLSVEEEVNNLIDEVRPDIIFHLAAISSVEDAWKESSKVFINNTISQINIFQALIKLRLKPKVLIASTGDVYGTVNNLNLPINENFAIHPGNPYASSKAAQELIGIQYFISHSIPVIITRAFNHSGPGQFGNFVIPSFASQIAKIEQGKQEAVLKVGNLAAKRDFSDVRDVISAYWELARKGEPGQTYNICSGKAVSIKNILDTLLNQSETKIAIEQDSNRMRPSDTPVVFGDNNKLINTTGWHPEIRLEKTLLDTLNFYRELEKNKEKV